MPVPDEIEAYMDLDDILAWYGARARRECVQRSVARDSLVWIVPLFGHEVPRAAISVQFVLSRTKECIQLVGPEFPGYEKAEAFVAQLEELIRQAAE